MDHVTLEFSGCVAHVQIGRPEKLNAVNEQTMNELVASGATLRGRKDCRAVVLSGAGRGFCAGLDLETLRAASNGGELGIDISHPYEGVANIAQHVVLQWRGLPMPVIAAVHGVAFGAGLQLALGADIRIVHPQAKLSVMEVKWGLIPDMAGMALLRELVRPDIVADLVLTARIFTGQEAEKFGMATQLSEDPLNAAMELARCIGSRSPDAVRAAKRLLTMPGSRDDILIAEASEQAQLFGQNNQREAVLAGLAKRAAHFQD